MTLDGYRFRAGAQANRLEVLNAAGVVIYSAGVTGLEELATGAGSQTLEGRLFQALRAGAGDDTLIGTPGFPSSSLYGEDGNDLLTGGGGNSLYGGAGNDMFRLTTGAESLFTSHALIDGGDGFDVLDVSLYPLREANGGFGQSLGDNFRTIVASFATGLTVTTVSIEKFVTAGGLYFISGVREVEAASGAASVTYRGDAAAQTLTGGRPSDSLFGGGGDDRLNGREGLNTLDGGSGVDTAVFAYTFAQADIRHTSFVPSPTVDTAARSLRVNINNPNGSDFVRGIEVFQFSDVTIRNDDGYALVDDLYYLTNTRDILAPTADAEAHYASTGWRLGRDPNIYFDTSAYLSANADVAAAGINPLEHYRAFGANERRDPSIWFDSEQYSAINKDIGGMNPLEHYLLYGAAEGRATYMAVGSNLVNGFDADYYRMAYEDVGRSGIDPMTHYLQYGIKEGRNPNAYFDTKYYLANNPDVAAAGVNPLQHYFEFGWKELRDPSASFDTSAYIERYSKVLLTAFLTDSTNPLKHYMEVGRLTGFQITPTTAQSGERHLDALNLPALPYLLDAIDDAVSGGGLWGDADAGSSAGLLEPVAPFRLPGELGDDVWFHQTGAGMASDYLIA
ncbi:hypothetical protein [Brevundimonas sp. TWP2-3-4b1]|uniref:hypothetical protein n=1 Tax=Brevundimonas sp. TWP2-3-4b1 TaxID=2804580 RepID=UPI003CF24874